MTSAFGRLSSEIVEYISSEGISEPTPIQETAIPQILDSDDCFLLSAPTGTGKTEAALLPLLHKLSARIEKDGGIFGIAILYITPLKALNRDVFKRVRGLCEHLGVGIDVRHGDTTAYARRKQALYPPNLMVTTPETLQAILPGKRMRFNLRSVTAVVVDEVHEIAGSKRGVQLAVALERLEHLVGRPVQRVGLSATVGNTREVARLVGGVGRPVKMLWAGYATRDLSMRVEMPVPTDKHHLLAKRLAYPAHPISRLDRIRELVEGHESTIVFANTRSLAETMGAKLRLLAPSLEFEVHHGSLSKDARLAAEHRLREGEIRAIIATSSLELGIDIGQVDLVIQYGSPRNTSRAVQRVGRAGHRVGGKSEGVIIATVNLDDVTESGVILRRARANRIERTHVLRRAWDVLAHQVAGIVLEHRAIDVRTILQIVRKASPFRNVSMAELNRIIDFLAKRGMLRRNEYEVKMGPRTRAYYYEGLSTIPDVQQVMVVDSITRSSIGVLDEEYVREYIDTGSTFVIRGRPYVVVSVDDEEVLCQPIVGTDPTAPRWIGEMIPVPFEVACEVADLWNKAAERNEREVRRDIKKRYCLEDAAVGFLLRESRRAREELGCLPSKRRIVIEQFPSGTVIHAPLGTQGNETLGLIVAAVLTTRIGSEILVEHDPYRILLVSRGTVDAQAVKSILRTYDREQINVVLRLALKNTQTFASRFVQVARRMGIVKRNARLRDIPVGRLIESYVDSPVFEEAMEEVLSEKMDPMLIGNVIDRVREGTVEITTVRTEKPSTLARLIVEHKTRFEMITEVTGEEDVLRLLEERLLSRRMRLVCMRGDWESIRTVSTLDDTVRCTRCGSTLVAVTNTTDKDLKQLIARVQRGESLTRNERRRYERAALSSSLVATYGKVAVMVLAGRGIGPETASRILRPGNVEHRLTLLRAVARAERDYARTHQYWAR